MSDLSGYSRYSVLLTMIAIGIAVSSLGMVWYKVTDGWWIDSFYLEGEVLSVMRAFVALWFLVSLIFVGRVLLGEPGLIKDAVVGVVVIEIGLCALWYSWANLPEVTGASIRGEFVLKLGAGVITVAIAAAIQILAVAIHLKGTYFPSRHVETDPYEARFGDGSTE